MTSNKSTISPTSERRLRVLVFRIGSLGDTCVAIPALHLIRKRFSNADIRVLTNFPVNAGIKAAPLHSVIGESGLVDSYFEYPLGLSSWRDMFHLCRQLRKWEPDVLVYLMPVRRFKQLLRDYFFFRLWVGVRNIVGLKFSAEAQNHLWDAEHQTFEPEAQRLLRNLTALGTIDLRAAASWNLSLQQREIESASTHLYGWPGAHRFIACSIGAKWDTKDWGQDRWEEWSASFSARHPDLGLAIVGAASEHSRSELVARHWHGPTLNLCGTVASPRESAAVIAKAACFVGHDSGPMHLAAAVGVPCVAVFSAQDKPGLWFPFGEHHRVIFHQTQCCGCRLQVCTEHAKKCIRSITVPEIIVATEEVLSGSQSIDQMLLTPAAHT